MDKQELLKRLTDLDEEVAMILPHGSKITVTIVGGSALIIQNCLSRATIDIDVVDIYYAELMPIFEKYDVNSRSNAYCDCMAYNYQDRLIRVDLPTKTVDFFTLSIEDLVIMKLFSDREKDYEDIRRIEVVSKLNWDLLKKIIDSGEVDISFNERRYKEFLFKYERYVKDYKNEAIKF